MCRASASASTGLRGATGTSMNTASILRAESALSRNLSTRRQYVSRIFGNDSSNGMKSVNSCENPKSVRVFRYARVSKPVLCHTSTSWKSSFSNHFSKFPATTFATRRISRDPSQSSG